MRRKVLRDCVIGVLLLFVLPLAELSGAIAQESVFTVQQPYFQKSPYTGTLDTGGRVSAERSIRLYPYVG